ncbi:MAG: alpha/beta hydrolase [Mariprofundaceae bacterium]|nr:alpha/beta hydrolase [Mariprofundaceae bacterium]
MVPILLIHGYASEGSHNPVEEIYGDLPAHLRQEFGDDAVVEIDLSRWISLSDGISLDDVSFAMQRALNEKFSHLLASGFHVVIHSTGALVVRNWIRRFSPKPSPVKNLVYLAGANFGSGLAHIGQGQLSRWGRLILSGTGRGTKVLKELEFGSWKTLDLHHAFLEDGFDMRLNYEVQEFCLNGSQTLPAMRMVPIRYIKEDSSDNTVRTSACNLNFNYIPVSPHTEGANISKESIAELMEQRLNNIEVAHSYYEYNLSRMCENREPVPFAVIFETAHFGADIGIVAGKDNRGEVIPLVSEALNTPYDVDVYRQVAKSFAAASASTFARAAELHGSPIEWNKQAQYEGHAQLIFRLRDQFGDAVEHFDITIRSGEKQKETTRLEDCIEDEHNNSRDKGAITFYLRTQRYNDGTWTELLDSVQKTNVEITGYEALSDEISYLPLTISLEPEQIRHAIQSFRTTIFDIELMRLPSDKVFAITKTP